MEAEAEAEAASFKKLEAEAEAEALHAEAEAEAEAIKNSPLPQHWIQRRDAAPTPSITQRGISICTSVQHTVWGPVDLS